jgi:hypothetical protein
MRAMRILKYPQATWVYQGALALIVVVVLLATESATHAESRASVSAGVLALAESIVAATGPSEPAAPIVEAQSTQPPEGTEPLAAYVLGAMNEWTRGRDAAPVTHKPEIAFDIAWVAIEEPRTWDGSNGAREAIVIASIAFWETRYRDYVDDGSCNRWAQEAYLRAGMLNMRVLPKDAQYLMQLGTCDGGQAASIAQIHFDRGGVVLVRDGSREWAYANEVKGEPITKTIAMRDRRAALRVALAMARQSIRRGAGLAQYCGGEHAVAKGRERLHTAEAWSRLHPFSH